MNRKEFMQYLLELGFKQSKSSKNQQGKTHNILVKEFQNREEGGRSFMFTYHIIDSPSVNKNHDLSNQLSVNRKDSYFDQILHFNNCDNLSDISDKIIRYCVKKSYEEGKDYIRYGVRQLLDINDKDYYGLE